MAAPLLPCLITTASAPIACKVCAVSFKLSPLLTDDPLAEKLITSAESLLAAVSKLILVLVESSKKRFTTVFPLSVGNFLFGPSVIAASSLPVANRARASSLERSATESRCELII